MSRANEETKHNPYQEYLDSKHAGFKTPENLVAKIAEKATGSKLVTRRKIIDGEVNEVYDVTLDKGNNVVVRISRSEEPRFEAEEKAIRMAAQVGVPTPKVLLIESLRLKEEKLTFCVEEKIEGVPLRDLQDSLSESTMRLLVSQAGNILSKIHTIRVNGFGSMDKKTPYKKWSNYILEPLREEHRIAEVAKGMNMKLSLVEKASEALKDNVNLFDQAEPKLLHGDFSMKHLLVNENEIVGIIDFEGARGGDPVFDLAWFDYFYGERIPREWIKDGYLDKSLFNKSFNTKMLLHKLHLGFSFMDYYEKENNRAGLEHVNNEFEKDVLLL